MEVSLNYTKKKTFWLISIVQRKRVCERETERVTLFTQTIQRFCSSGVCGNQYKLLK